MQTTLLALGKSRQCRWSSGPHNSASCRPGVVSVRVLEDLTDGAVVVDEPAYTYLVCADDTGERIGFEHLFEESRRGGSRRTIRGTLLDDAKTVEPPGGNLLGSCLAPGATATGRSE